MILMVVFTFFTTVSSATWETVAKFFPLLGRAGAVR